MGKANIGQLIRTALNNIHSQGELTETERSIANQIAPLIEQSQRNWIPIYVREISTQNYQLIGSAVVLEANKLAKQDIIYCIQVDDREETKNQIIKVQEILQDSQSASKSISKIQQHTLDRKLFVNQESQQSLKTKLAKVSGIGDKTASKMVEDILKKRPFSCEQEFRSSVTGFHAKAKSKAKVPKHEQLWQSLNSVYILEW